VLSYIPRQLYPPENSAAIHSTGGQVDYRTDIDIEIAWRKKYPVYAKNQTQVRQSSNT